MTDSAVAAAGVPSTEADKKTDSSKDMATDLNSGVKPDAKPGNGHGEHQEDENSKSNGRGDRGFRHVKRGSYSRNSRPSYRRNEDFQDLPETDDHNEIRNQVEFYFSSQNLASDQHLFMELKGPENQPVSIKHLHTFKRMRRFNPYSAIVAALRDSEDLVVVDDDKKGNEAVKRKEPLVVEVKEGDKENPPTTLELFHRLRLTSSNDLGKSIYAKGFGNEAQAGQIALEEFFRPFGAVVVRKRRDDNNNWKGSVFVEFDTKESQEQFLALDPTPSFRDNQILVKGKKEYVEEKCAEKGIKPDWELTQEEMAARNKQRREDEGSRRPRGSWDRNNFSGHRRGRGGRGGRGGGRGGRGPRGRSRSRSTPSRSDGNDRSRSRSRSRSPRRHRGDSRSHSRSESPKRRHRHRSRSSSTSRSRSRSPSKRKYRNRSHSPRRQHKHSRSHHRHHHRSRSPRRHRHHRDRSASRDSVDSRDWNARRDRYRKGKDDRASKRKENKDNIERDAYGVPVVKDTRSKDEIAAANKRKASGEARDASSKKGKFDFKDDE